MPSFSFKMFFFSYKIHFFVYLQNIYLFHYLLRNIFNEKQAIKQRLDEYSPSSPTVNLT